MSMWWTCLAAGGVTVWVTPGEARHAGSAAVPCAADPPSAAWVSGPQPCLLASTGAVLPGTAVTSWREVLAAQCWRTNSSADLSAGCSACPVTTKP